MQALKNQQILIQRCRKIWITPRAFSTPAHKNLAKMNMSVARSRTSTSPIFRRTPRQIILCFRTLTSRRLPFPSDVKKWAIGYLTLRQRASRRLAAMDTTRLVPCAPSPSTRAFCYHHCLLPRSRSDRQQLSRSPILRRRDAARTRAFWILFMTTGRTGSRQAPPGFSLQ
jgi:hypothetical protein